MPNTIGLNVVMKGDNSDLVSKAQEAKKQLSYLQESTAGSPINAAANSNNQTPLNQSSPVNSNGFIYNNLLEINKSLLEEIKNISNYLIKGNGKNPLDKPNNPNTPDNPTSSEFSKKIAQNITKGLTTGVAIASSVISGVLNYDTGSRRMVMAERNGDPYSADISGIDRTTNTVKGATTGFSIAGGLIGSAIGPVGTLVGSGIGKGLQEIINSTMESYNDREKAIIEEQRQVTDIYKGRMNINERSMLLFNGADANINSASHNANTGLHSQKLARNWSVNTGMSLDEFQTLMNGFSNYGISTDAEAARYARASALMTTYTGVDTSGLYGLQARLGNNVTDTDNSIRKAYGASRASGLTMGQFGEFLTGLQNAVEEGISQGFTRSTDDVSKTMVMMSKLSGGDPAWEGKYGFAKLNQMNQGLKNATSLNSSTHLLAMQSLRGLNTGEQGVEYIDGQDALNTLALMEKGFDAKSFGAIANTFGKKYGNNVTENVLAWKNLTGLNYNGAMKLYEMQKEYEKNGGHISQKEIEELQANPEYQSDSKNMTNYLNSIASNTAILGEQGFRNYIQKLSEISAKHSIYEDSDSFKIMTERGIENKKDPDEYRNAANKKFLRNNGDKELYNVMVQAQNNPDTTELAISKIKDVMVYDNEQRKQELKDLVNLLKDAIETSEIRFEMSTN